MVQPLALIACIPLCPPFVSIPAQALRGGKKLDPEVESFIMTSGVLLLTAVGVWLVIKDLLGLILPT